MNNAAKLRASDNIIPLASPSLVTGSASAQDAKSLTHLYNGMFEGILADTEELIDECYRLRYQAYCVEHPFLDPDPDAGEYERDEFDGHAAHALLRHRQTGEYIGTVRLIVDTKDSPKQLPASQIAENNNLMFPHQIYRDACGEASRFCIAKSFRRRITDTMYASSYTPRELAEIRGRVIPFMALGLMKLVFDMCKEHGMRQCVAVMEPSLLRLLDKLGIHFQPVGGRIDYHGERQLCYITNTALYESLLKERPDVLELMTDGGRSPLIY